MAKNKHINVDVKDVLKTVLVLALIAIVSGGLLGGINAVTYISDDEMLSRKMVNVYTADSFINLSTTADENFAVEKEIVNKYNKGSKNPSLALLPVKNGAVEENTVIYRVYGAGDYDCTLLVLVVGDKITKISVYSSSATPGIGDKAYKDTYIKQFNGLNLITAEPFVVVKNNASKDNEVNAVAGATKSSEAVKNAVNNAMALHKLLKGEAK